MSTTENLLDVPDAPGVPGLSFRRFGGEADYPVMADILERCRPVDGIESAETVEDIARSYSHLTHCDPYQDMIFAQVHGQAAGYGRVFWWQETAGEQPFIYVILNWVVPEWRGRGIGTAMLRWQENRLRQIAAGHPSGHPRLFQAGAADSEAWKTALLEREGYRPVTVEAVMVRPDLENIPDLPLPDGVEVRPVTPEHYRAIWEHDVEAFRDHWGYAESQFSLEEFLDFPDYTDPALWRVAWHGDQIVGQVLSFIDPRENEKYGRKRGYTEDISVKGEYRRQGIASALIAHSLRALKERGMEEAALGVHTENPNGAFRLYEKMGYRVVKLFATYRKPLD